MKIRFSAFSIFLLGFAFILFILWGLPFQFGDDLNVIHAARGVSWQPLLKELVNPFTPAWYVHGEACLFSTRVFETILFKYLYNNFGYTTSVFWCLKALGYAGTGAFIFLLLYMALRSTWISVFGALFYLILPPVYLSTAWIADLEILAQMFLAISFYFFLKSYLQTDRSKFSILQLLAAFVSAWLAIKLKETARIIPFTLIGFLIVHQNFKLLGWIRKSLKNALFTLFSFALLFAVIPWRKDPTIQLDARSHSAIFSLKFSNLLLTFAPLLHHVVILAFCAVFLILAFGQIRKKSAMGRLEAYNPYLPHFLFVSIWCALCAAGFAMNFKVQNNTRYLTTLLVPLTVWMWLVIGIHWNLVRDGLRPWMKYVLISLLLCAVLFQVKFERDKPGSPYEIQIDFNIDEVVFLRNRYTGTDVADYLLTKQIYEDYFSKKDASWQDLDDFYRGNNGLPKEAFHEMRIKEWDTNSRNDLRWDSLQTLSEKWGKAYILSFRGDLFRNNSQIERIYQSTTATDSWYSRILPRIKSKVHRDIFLYRVQA